ncbi:MAG: transcriptional repressor [Planctomycetales bacterium]|nr:transcriptional repressor [Planctomycetales bacterium]
MTPVPVSRRPAPDVARWCDEFEATCRARGVRVTPQRLAVYRALAEDLSHPTAEAVWARLRPRMPSLSPATVYRILESLDREGLVRRVSVTDGAGRFDANRGPHQHLVCRVCGRVRDVRDPTLTRVGLGRDAVRGFTVEELDIRIVGRCGRCRK